MRATPIPPIADLSVLPRELEGQWVLLKIADGTQQIVASGEDVREVVRGFPRTTDYLLTRVPTWVTTYVVGNAD